MTTKTFILFLLFFPSVFVSAQTSTSDKILGVWLNEEKDGEIEIYKTGNRYFGKIVGGKNLLESDGKTLRKDAKNPDSKLRNKQLLYLVILTDFNFDGKEWSGGKIYDPKSGRTYSSTMKLNGHKLELRGYVGISLFGRTTLWERAN